MKYAFRKPYVLVADNDLTAKKDVMIIKNGKIEISNKLNNVVGSYS